MVFSKRVWLIIAAFTVTSAGLLWWFLWHGLIAPPMGNLLNDKSLPPGFVSANGRLEATEIDVATKLAGRVATVLAREGDIVESGTIVARIDTASLEAQLHQAQAELERASKDREYAQAIVVQRESEKEYADRELKRHRALEARNFTSQDQLDQAQTSARTMEAALLAARIKVAETDAAIQAAQAQIDRIAADIEDSALKAPRRGRVLYRLAEPGEVLGAGGKVLTLLDLTDVYMVFFMPETVAGRLAIGSEARIVLDAGPEFVVPAHVSFVAARAQFTPKQVETRSEREKLVFRVKARIDPELLRRYEPLVKTGLPGVIYVRLDPTLAWPNWLFTKLPTWPYQHNNNHAKTPADPHATSRD